MFLEYLKFILYGLIQGFTEFIPVSSTAHLKIISLFLGLDDCLRLFNLEVFLLWFGILEMIFLN